MSNEWINVETNPPEVDQNVLLYGVDFPVFQVGYLSNDKEFAWKTRNGFELESWRIDVFQYYMPLPSPPDTGEK